MIEISAYQHYEVNIPPKTNGFSLVLLDQELLWIDLRFLGLINLVKPKKLSS